VEAWAEIEGTAGAYQVSNLGRVRRTASERIRRLQSDEEGYQRVKLGKRTIRVHREVLRAFVGPPPSPEHEGDHRNGDKTNNAVDNLRWATPSLNKRNHRHHPCKGKSGKRCVRRKGKLWQAYAKIGNRMCSLGHYKLRSDAVKARTIFEIMVGLHG